MNIDIEYLTPAFGRDVQRRTMFTDTGVVDEDIDRSKFGFNGIEHWINGINFGDIGCHRECPMSGGLQISHSLLAQLDSTRHHGDGRPGLGQRLCQGLADAGVAAGHHGCLPAQVERGHDAHTHRSVTDRAATLI